MINKSTRFLFITIFILLLSAKTVHASSFEETLTLSYINSIEDLIRRLRDEMSGFITRIKMPDNILIPRPIQAISPSPFITPTPTITLSPTPTAADTLTSIPEVNDTSSVSATPSPLPNDIPEATVTTLPTHSLFPTPILTPQASMPPAPTILRTPSPTYIPQNGSIQSYIMQQINDYRKSLGLSTVTINVATCNFATTRAEEISQNFTHNGFINRQHNQSLPYNSYSYVTENIAMNSDYRQVVPGWVSSPGHAENMRVDTPYVCVENYGNFYAYEGLKP